MSENVEKYEPPTGRVLTEGTRDLLAIVLTRGTPEQKATLRPFEHYTFAFDPEQMACEEARYDAALDELRDLALEAGS